MPCFALLCLAVKEKEKSGEDGPMVVEKKRGKVGDALERSPMTRVLMWGWSGRRTSEVRERGAARRGAEPLASPRDPRKHLV